MNDFPRDGIARRSLAVWRRNFLVWRKLMGPSLVLNFGEPAIYLLGLGFGLGYLIGDISGMPYLTFLASGIVASSAMNTASFEGMYSVYTRMVPQLTYDAMLATPVEIADIVIGEMLWCATKSVISGTAILCVAIALGAAEPWSVLVALPILFLTGLCFAGPALIMTAISPGYDFFSYYTTLVITPMWVLSGVFYPVSNLPEALHYVSVMLPLTHSVELIRDLVGGGLSEDSLIHFAVLGVFTVIGGYVAIMMIKRRLIV